MEVPTDVQQAAEARAKSLEANSPYQPLTPPELPSSLDASLKKNTSFVKRLSSRLSPETAPSMLEEAKGLHLGRYQTEVFAALLSAPLTKDQLSPSSSLLSLLHSRFGPLQDSSQAIKAAIKAGDTSRRRVLLRFGWHLYFCGLLPSPDDSVWLSQVTAALASTDSATAITSDDQSSSSSSSSSSTTTNTTTAISSASNATHGTISSSSSLATSSSTTTTTTNSSALSSSASSTAAMFPGIVLLTSVAKVLYPLLRKELENPPNPLPIISEDATARIQRAYSKYWKALTDAFDFAASTLTSQEEANAISLASTGIVPEQHSAAAAAASKTVTRLLGFCTNLAPLLGETPPTPPAPPDPNSTTRLPSGPSVSIIPGGRVQSANAATQSLGLFDDAETKAFYEDLPNVIDAPPPLSSPPLDDLLKSLPSIVSLPQADELSLSLSAAAAAGAKPTRTKISRTLFAVPRTSLHLLPFYSRIAATLSTRFPDIGSTLIADLDAEFATQQALKDPVKIESKIRNIRFWAELVKFKLAPPAPWFAAIHQALDSFTQHNIDVVVAGLDTAGRWLYRNPETHIRASATLDKLSRLRAVRVLDARRDSDILSVVYTCKPPPGASTHGKPPELPPLQAYIHHLLYKVLAKPTVDSVLKSLRKLPWTKPEEQVEDTVLSCALDLPKLPYESMHLMASVVSGLTRYYDSLGIRLVDAVMEVITTSLEAPDWRVSQLRLMYVRFLGELYNYRIVDSAVIFDSAWLLISYGALHPTMDPPGDAWRIRAVTALLNCCGTYFDRGAQKRRLDEFLKHFDMYIAAKGTIPMDVHHGVSGLWERLRPKATRPSPAATARNSADAVAAAAAAAAVAKADDASNDNTTPTPAASAPAGSDATPQKVGQTQEFVPVSDSSSSSATPPQSAKTKSEPLKRTVSFASQPEVTLYSEPTPMDSLSAHSPRLPSPSSTPPVSDDNAFSLEDPVDWVEGDSDVLSDDLSSWSSASWSSTDYDVDHPDAGIELHEAVSDYDEDESDGYEDGTEDGWSTGMDPYAEDEDGGDEEESSGMLDAYEDEDDEDLDEDLDEDDEEEEDDDDDSDGEEEEEEEEIYYSSDSSADSFDRALAATTSEALRARRNDASRTPKAVTVSAVAAKAGPMPGASGPFILAGRKNATALNLPASHPWVQAREASTIAAAAEAEELKNRTLRLFYED